MSRRGWTLFLLTGLLWGIPYLAIKIAVDPENGFSPAAVVCIRTGIGAAILLPWALFQKSLKDALRGIRYIIPYAILEMIGPWILIATAEQKLPSGLSGLLVASVPFFASIFAWLRGDSSVWHHKRLIGMIVGFIGLVLVVGIESINGSANLTAIGMILLASIGYAYAVMYVQGKLPGVSGVAINAVAMLLTSIFYLPIAVSSWPTHNISSSAINSVIVLGVFSSGLAFALFFTLVTIIDVARASLVTYLNTAFAVVLGVIVLDEPLTIGIVLGLPLVLVGSYFASRKENHNA